MTAQALAPPRTLALVRCPSADGVRPASETGAVGEVEGRRRTRVHLYPSGGRGAHLALPGRAPALPCPLEIAWAAVPS